MNQRLAVLALFFAPCIAPLAAAAADTPTDTDLKSTYCLRALNLQLQAVNSVINSDSADSRQATLLAPTVQAYKVDIDRLNSYLFPKLPRLDPAAIVAAAQRADQDDKVRLTEMQKCTAECAPAVEANGAMGEKWTTCARNCRAQSPSFARMDACHPVNWLPF